MMGQLPPAQNALFYDFSLEKFVSQDHLLRQIDPLLYLRDLRDHLASYYSHTGRPSVDPELMIRMLIVGYCYGIRSERRLCEEVCLFACSFDPKFAFLREPPQVQSYFIYSGK